MSLTPKQEQVVNFNEGNIVVSASAGSGKTSVMIKRIIRLILEGKASLNEILAVTFTKSASAEMKQKVASALIEEIKKGNNVELLKKQLELLPLASISTVHSFCANLLRTYFYEADVDSQFGVLDSAGATELKARAIDEVFDSLYEVKDEGLNLLLSIFVSNRTDEGLRSTILSVYEFAISERDIDEFLSKSLSFYSADGQKTIINRLIDLFKQKIKGYANSLKKMGEGAEVLGEQKLSAYMFSYAMALENALCENDFTSLVLAVNAVKTTKPRTTSKDEAVNELNAEHASLKASLRSFMGSFSELVSSYQDDNIGFTDSKVVLENIIRIVEMFAKKFLELKKELNVLDFSDLEHKTYNLLQNQKTCEEISSNYKFVFVDEYQDTNGIQEAIFNKISNDNLFIVGDVKQSIYSFRGCNPDIFRKKIEDCKNGYGVHVDLDKNFRSAKSIIDVTNNIFNEIMQESSAGVDYRRFPMVSCDLYGEHNGEVMLHVVEDEKQEETLDVGVYSVQKHLEVMKQTESGAVERAVASLIAKEVGTPYFDAKLGCVRPLGYGDFVVLTLKKSGLCDRIASELVKSGIPVLSQSKRSIGEYPEIKLMVNLLQFISNPMSDIPLASVLKSAIGGMSDEELSSIRAIVKDGVFYDACKKYIAEKQDEISLKLQDFFDYFEKIRLISQFDTAGSVLRKIVKERNFDISLLAKPMGDVKVSRCERFISAGNDKTVWEYLSQMDGLLENMNLIQTGSENSVEIMTYHASKGLEFPVVILPDISERFTLLDMRGNVIFDRNWGLGVKNYNLETMVEKNSFVRNFIRFNKPYERTNDYMRLFYVALTRAKFKLHLISTALPQKEHNPEKSLKANKLLDFLALSDMPVFENDLGERTYELGEARPLIIGKADEKTCKKIEEFVSFKYPFEADTTLNLKRSVTAVNQNFAVEADDGGEGATYTFKPIFAVDAKETGVAYHKYLEKCDFLKPVSEELAKLIASGEIAEEQISMLSQEKLEKIMAMDVFKNVSTMKLYREQPFILNVPSELIGENASQEEVLVQGIIDLLAVSGENAYVIDYKFSSKSNDKLKETYAKQVELYAYAVEKVLKLKVKGKYLVNLNSTSVVEL